MNYTQDLKLIPNKYRKIAYLLFIFPLFVVISSQLNWVELEKETIKQLFFSLLFIPLLIIALSKDKVEDELTLKIRVNAYAANFLFAISFVVSYNLYGILVNGKSKGVEVNLLVLIMFIVYFIQKGYAKYKR